MGGLEIQLSPGWAGESDGLVTDLPGEEKSNLTGLWLGE